MGSDPKTIPDRCASGPDWRPQFPAVRLDWVPERPVVSPYWGKDLELFVKKSRGFTLIELLVVVAVVALLAAIALPSYLSQTRKSRRSAVESAMQQLALKQESFRGDCSTYATDFSFACASGAPPTYVSLASLYPSSTYYTVTLPAVTSSSSTAYTIKAVATSVGGQDQDKVSGIKCNVLYYTFGVDTATGTACSTITGTTVTTSTGTLTKCPATCW